MSDGILKNNLCYRSLDNSDETVISWSFFIIGIL